MTKRPDRRKVSDAGLVAFVDGVLEGERRAAVARIIRDDPAVRSRHDLLKKGSRPFRAAFDHLLEEAPAERLEAILAAAKRQATAAPLRGRTERSLQRFALAASLLLAVFAAGALAGVQMAPFLSGEDGGKAPVQKGWLYIVAEYQQLFSPETLSLGAGEKERLPQAVAAAGRYLGKGLTLESVTVEGLDLRRALLYRYKERPLVQLAYLHDGRIPVSLCIIAGRRAAREPRSVQLEGFNIVHWDSAEHGFMVIGKMPRAALEEIARALRRKLST
ncbi:MAG: hypothetical protein Kow0032_13910 [Methyloligellaceae bacterium]